MIKGNPQQSPPNFKRSLINEVIPVNGNTPPYAGLTLSDVHLGHQRTPTEKIAENLRLHFIPLIKTVKVLIISGDYFDRLLTASSHQYRTILGVTVEIIAECEKHRVAIRVLKGTPGHDYEQSSLFQNFSNFTTLDVKYFDDITIELNGPGGFSYLYIPDEIDDTTEITKERIKQLMRSMGLKQVDIVVMHGAFEYQLPKGIIANFHDIDFFNSIAKYVVFNGHIHEHSTNGKVVVPGSFDGTTFADKSPKGFIWWCINKDKFKFKFIKNLTQQVYKTITFKTLDDAVVLKRIAKEVEGLVDGSRIRIMASVGSFVATFEPTLTKKYPQFIWQFDEKGGKQKSLDFTDDIRSGTVAVSITPENVSSLISEQLASHDIKNIEKHLSVLEGYL